MDFKPVVVVHMLLSEVCVSTKFMLALYITRLRVYSHAIGSIRLHLGTKVP